MGCARPHRESVARHAWIRSASLDREEDSVSEQQDQAPPAMRREAESAHSTPDTTQTFGHDSDLSFVPFGSDLSQAELDAISALPARAALLLVRSGPTAGARYLLDSEVATVGRHPEADIFFDDVTVSRRHAEITRRPEGFELVDRFGPWVTPAPPGDHADRADAEVRIGKFRLTFFISPVDLPLPADG